MMKVELSFKALEAGTVKTGWLSQHKDHESCKSFGKWHWHLSASHKRAEVYGPDGRYRLSCTPKAAENLCDELNSHDSRVK